MGRMPEFSSGSSSLVVARRRTSLACVAAVLVAVVLLLATGAVRAQADADDNDIGRLRYDYQRGIGERMRAFSTVSYEQRLESEDPLSDRKKAVLKGGVSYNSKNWLRLEAGVGMYYSWRENIDDLFEIRLWQAATLDWPEVRALARWVVHHRFMVEERFQHADGWETSFRGRYRLSFTIPINRYTVEPGAVYMPVEGELFWDIDDNETELFADRERLTAGLGYQFSSDWAAELRYVWQESRAAVTDDFSRDDSIIELRVKSTIRIRDYLKIR